MQSIITVNTFIFCIMLTALSTVDAENPWQMNSMKIYCNAHMENRTISMEGCGKEYALAISCMGLCRSYSVVLPNPPYFESKYECCKPIRTVTKFYRIKDCNSGIEKTVKMESAAGCSCQKT